MNRLGLPYPYHNQWKPEQRTQIGATQSKRKVVSFLTFRKTTNNQLEVTHPAKPLGNHHHGTFYQIQDAPGDLSPVEALALILPEHLPTDKFMLRWSEIVTSDDPPTS